MAAGERIYRHLPTWAQHAAVSAFGLRWYWLRFGPGFGRYRREYAERERFTAREWQDWQERRLREVLTVAADQVPYYRRHWDSATRDEARAGRLASLPRLGKEPLRAAPRAFVRSDRRAHPELVFSTSGTTGTPIASIWTAAELRRSMAVREVRSAGWAGVSFHRPRATFSGRMVVPDPESSGPFHRFNLIERQVYFSAYHLSARTAARYVAALHRHGIQWLTGYAVSFYVLAKLILEQNLEVPPLTAVIATSEKVTRKMRQTMERAYRCRVWEEYSTVENVLLASECEKGRLHVSPDVGRVEILRPDGSPCDPGETGEVVATTLMRDYQPIVRLRLGDLAAWDPEPCPCGRALPVLEEVVGRIEDVVVTPDGRQMVRFPGVFADLPHVREVQIVQETLFRLRLRVVAAPGFDAAEEAEMMARVHRRLGSRVEVVIETVDQIPRTAAGKFQAIVSHLDRPEAETTGVEPVEPISLP